MIGITRRSEFPAAWVRASVLRALRKLATTSSRLMFGSLVENVVGDAEFAQIAQ